MYTLRERYQEVLLSLQTWRLPWKLLLLLLGGRNSFSSFFQWMDSHPCLMSPVFCFSFEHCKDIFSCLMYPASLSQPNCSFKKMAMSQSFFQNPVRALTLHWYHHHANEFLIFQLYEFRLVLHIKIISQNIKVPLWRKEKNRKLKTKKQQ